MKEKLLSRKFWVVVATFVAGLAKVLFDIEVDDQALVGGAAIVITYLGGQSWVDAKAAANAVSFASRNALASAESYARTLETELAEVGQETTT